MTSVEIAKETGQDPRSINGRVGLLIDQGLVQRYPIVSSGISTHLIVYKRFIKDNRESSFPRGNIGIDMNQLRIAIVSSVKNAKNGLREHEDLRMEVGMDKSHRLQIAFNKAVRRLEAAGFIKRVIVKVKDRPDERFRCVKFVQDLPPDADNASSSESDNDAFDDLDDDLEKEENDEKKNSLLVTIFLLRIWRLKTSLKLNRMMCRRRGSMFYSTVVIPLKIKFIML